MSNNNDILGFNPEDMDPANDNGRPVRRGKGKKRGGNIAAIVKQRGGGNRPVVEPKPEPKSEDKPSLSREESESMLDSLLGGDNLVTKEEVVVDLEVVGEVQIPQQTPPQMTTEDAEALNAYLFGPEPTDAEIMQNWLIEELPEQLLNDEELKAAKVELDNLGLDPVQKHNLLNELNVRLLDAPTEVLKQVGKRSVIELQTEYYALVVDINKEMVAKAKTLATKPVEVPAVETVVVITNPTITPAPVEVPEVPVVNPVLADAKAHEGACIAAHESDNAKTIMSGSIEVVTKGKPVPNDRLVFEFLELREVDGAQYWAPKFHRPVKPDDVVDCWMLERIMCNGVGRNQAYIEPITKVIVPCAVEVLPEGHLWIKKVESQDGCSIIHLDPAA